MIMPMTKACSLHRRMIIKLVKIGAWRSMEYDPDPIGSPQSMVVM